MKIHYYKQVDSTQTKCQELYSELDEWSIVAAESQTSGYGRTGLWDSSDSNIYMSIKVTDIKVNLLLPIISVGLCKVLNEHEVKAYLKLPNDIYVNKKKLGGILIEPFANGYIVGIGINVQLTNVDGRTSLLNERKSKWINNNLISQFQQVFIDLEMKKNAEIMNMYQDVTILKNQEIMIVDRRTQETKLVKVNKVDTEKIYTNDSEYSIMQYKFNY